MKYCMKLTEDFGQNLSAIKKAAQPPLSRFNLKTLSHGNGNDLNSKILKITMKIKDQYPELSKYLEEMKETIPAEKHPGVTQENMELYYDSLISMLEEYISGHL